MDSQKAYFDEVSAKLDRLIKTTATKEDIANMATKDDIKELNNKINRVIDVMATQDDITELRTEMRTGFAELRESVSGLAKSVDKLLKVLTDLQSEYAAIKMQMDRYDRWFKQLAEKTGIELRP